MQHPAATFRPGAAPSELLVAWRWRLRRDHRQMSKAEVVVALAPCWQRGTTRMVAALPTRRVDPSLWWLTLPMYLGLVAIVPAHPPPLRPPLHTRQ